MLGLVLTLILLVVLRMMCASYRDTGRQQQQQPQKPKTVRHKQRPPQPQQPQHLHQQQDRVEEAGEEARHPHPMVGLMTIAEYPGGVESYQDQQGYLQYPHYYYHPYLHYPPYTEGEPGQEAGDGQEEGQVVAGVPYAHVRYATSDTVYTV